MRSLQLHPSSECGHSSSTPLLTPAPHGSVRSGTRAVTACDERCFVCVSLWCVYWGGGAWRRHHKYLRTMFRSARASSISTSCWTGENTATSFSVGDRLKSTPCISKPYAVIHTQDPWSIFWCMHLTPDRLQLTDSSLQFWQCLWLLPHWNCSVRWQRHRQLCEVSHWQSQSQQITQLV